MSSPYQQDQPPQNPQQWQPPQEWHPQEWQQQYQWEQQQQQLQQPQPQQARPNRTGFSIAAIAVSGGSLFAPLHDDAVLWFMMALAVFFGFAGLHYSKHGEANKPLSIVGFICAVLFAVAFISYQLS